MEEWYAPTFVTDEDLLRWAWYWGWVFPLSLIVTFLWLYNRAIKRRMKEREEDKKNLTNVKHRTNGHHKHKVHE